MDSETQTDQPDIVPRKKRKENDLLALWAIHEPAYSGLLTGDGFRWDPDTQDYTSDTGTRLGPNQIRSLAIHFATACELDLEQNAALLVNGDIDADEWHRRAQQEVDDEYFLLAALGVGGIDNLQDDDYQTIVGKLTTDTQMGSGILDAQERLLNFRDELTAPKPADASPDAMGEAGSAKQVINRAGMYAHGGESMWASTQQNSYRRLAQQLQLEIEERNILDDGAIHCRPRPFTFGCPELTAVGWQKIGSLPPPGSERSCGPNCRCHFEYRISHPDAQSTDESASN